MASPLTASLSTAAKLEQANRELYLVSSRLQKVRDNLGKIAGEFLFYERIYRNVCAVDNFLWPLSHAAAKLSLAAWKLSKTASLICKVASKNALVSPPAQKTFHSFPYLPAELRIMIWTAAAQPPPCMHYFVNFELTLGGREPAAQFMDDRGLWTACLESRRAVQRAYQKRSAYFEKAYCSFDRKSSETYCRRLAKYNESGSCFKKQLRELNWTMKIGFHRMEQLLDSLMSDRRHPFLAKVTKETFGMGPGWKLGEEEVPVGALERLCTDLKDEYLS